MSTPKILCPKHVTGSGPCYCGVKPKNSLTPIKGTIVDSPGYVGYSALFSLAVRGDVDATVLIISDTPEKLEAVCQDVLRSPLDKEKMQKIAVFPEERVTLGAIYSQVHQPRTPRQRD